jgi:hypothetical protein
VDDLFRTGPDAPTIGLLLLCETNNSALAEYALRDVAKPIAVSTYRVTRELPGAVRDELPTVGIFDRNCKFCEYVCPEGGCSVGSDRCSVATFVASADPPIERNLPGGKENA